MKNTSLFLRKGFTLVELMIVIAIIGILAAVLYPSLSGYLESARDTARQASLKNYSLALFNLYQNEAVYPKEDKCITKLYEENLKPYMTKGVEKDPKNGNTVGNCAAEWGYQYKALKLKDSDSETGNAFAIAAKMEKWSNANFDLTNWGDTLQSLENANLKNLIVKWSAESKALKDNQERAGYVVTQ